MDLTGQKRDTEKITQDTDTQNPGLVRLGSLMENIETRAWGYYKQINRQIKIWLVSYMNSEMGLLKLGRTHLSRGAVFRP